MRPGATLLRRDHSSRRGRMGHTRPLPESSQQGVAAFPIAKFLACVRRHLLRRRLDKELRLLLADAGVPYDDDDDFTNLDHDTADGPDGPAAPPNPLDEWLFKSRHGPSGRYDLAVLHMVARRIQRCFRAYVTDVRNTLSTMRHIVQTLARDRRPGSTDTTYLVFRREDADLVHALAADVLKRFSRSTPATYTFYALELEDQMSLNLTSGDVGGPANRLQLHNRPVKTLKSMPFRRSIVELGVSRYMVKASKVDRRRLGLLRNRGTQVLPFRGPPFVVLRRPVNSAS